MLCTGWYTDDRSGFHTDRVFTFGLVPATTGRAQQDLITGSVRAVVDMPVITAARLESDVAGRDRPIGQRCWIALPDEVPGESIIGFPKWEYLVEFGLSHRLLLSAGFMVPRYARCWVAARPCQYPSREGLVTAKVPTL